MYFIPLIGETDTRSRDTMKPFKSQPAKLFGKETFRKKPNQNEFLGKIQPKHLKSQSAMEYLMTYGWAILIIAIVIIALVRIGLFSNNLAPRAQPGNCYVSQTVSGGTLAGTCNGELPEFVAQFSNSGSSQVSVPNAAQLNPTQALTMSVWADITTMPSSGSPALVVKGLVNTQYEIYISIPNMQGEVTTSVGSWCQIIPSTPLGSWNNYIISYDGANVITYYNGAVQNKCSQTGQIASSSNPLDIGIMPGGYGSITGLISNVQIYNASLPASDVKTLYLEGIGGAPIDTNYLVGWWPLNGNANDYSGYNNNGVPTSVTYSSSWISGYTQP